MSALALLLSLRARVRGLIRTPDFAKPIQGNTLSTSGPISLPDADGRARNQGKRHERGRRQPRAMAAASLPKRYQDEGGQASTGSPSR